jgi:hypothetical protein
MVRLQKLKAVYDSGLCTKDEYDERRRALLEQIMMRK